MAIPRPLMMAAIVSLLASTFALPPATADVPAGLSIHQTRDGPAVAIVDGCGMFVRATSMLGQTGMLRILSTGPAGPTVVAEMAFTGSSNGLGLFDALIGPVVLGDAATGLVARTEHPDPTLTPLVSPAFESLGCEPTCTSGMTSIASTFNGNEIRAGDTIWYSAVFKPKARDVAATYRFVGGSIAYDVGGVPQVHAVPDAIVVMSPTATKATTVFSSGTWITTVPLGFDKPIFLSGLAMPVASDLPGGIKPVTWTGRFIADQPGLMVEWKWAAAVYTSFSGHETLRVKPIDGGKLSDFANSDHAGTPQDHKKAVIGGARGGGGSNYTGSLTSTLKATACHVA